VRSAAQESELQVIRLGVDAGVAVGAAAADGGGGSGLRGARIGGAVTAGNNGAARADRGAQGGTRVGLDRVAGVGVLNVDALGGGAAGVRGDVGNQHVGQSSQGRRGCPRRR